MEVIGGIIPCSNDDTFDSMASKITTLSTKKISNLGFSMVYSNSNVMDHLARSYKQYKCGTYASKEIILKQVIKTTTTRFREGKLKKVPIQQREIKVLLSWDVCVVLHHTEDGMQVNPS